MLSILWVFFLAAALLSALFTGRVEALSAAVTQGATEAVSLAINMAGLMAFWSGIMEIAEASGLSEKISRLLHPLLRPLFEKQADEQTLRLISANVTANLLGLSNAATPLGLQAIERLYDNAGGRGTPNCVLTLIVLNTTSIQLIPTTVAALRAGLGAASPFAILLPVLIASALSVATGLMMCRLLRPFFPNRTS